MVESDHSSIPIELKSPVPVVAALWVLSSETRREYVRVGSSPTSLLAEVSEDNTHIPAWFSGFLTCVCLAKISQSKQDLQLDQTFL